MEPVEWRDRVAADPEIHHGEPCISGTRVPVRTLMGSLADGLTVKQVIAEYAQLTSADAYGALAYAAEVPHKEGELQSGTP